MVVILGAALLIFGPRKLPELGRTLGRGLAEFRRATSDLKRSIDVELDEEKRPPPPRRTDTPRTRTSASDLDRSNRPSESGAGAPSDPAA